MSYFNRFPQLLYSTSLGVKNYKLVPNILAKVGFVKNALENSSQYYLYDVKDGERPEHIAKRIYDDPTKHWIILLANNIVDPMYDWVLSQTDFEKYINKKYSTIDLQLRTTDTYANNYIIGERVFQGDSFEDSDVTGKVSAFDSTNKILTVGFCSDVLANSNNIVGVTSLESHQILSVFYNDDGYAQASGNTIHYRVTETILNSYDRTENIKKYIVSVDDYNYSTDAVIDRTMTESTNSYNLSDGTTLTVTKSYTPVTYYDYELELNETKRRIRVPKSEIVSSIEKEFDVLMKG